MYSKIIFKYLQLKQIKKEKQMEKNTQKISIALLIALVGFPQISETIYSPALPNVAKSLSASANLVEATLAIYFLGFAIGVLLWGTISDKYGRRPAMLIGLVIYGLGTFACATVSSVESLLGWRFLQAFGASVGSVITQTILRDAYEGKARTKLFSIISGALAFMPAIGPLLGGFISEFLGWRTNFWMLAILALILFSWTFVSLPETRPHNLKKTFSFGTCFVLLMDMAKDLKLWGHLFLIGATNGILFGFYQEAPFLFIEKLQISSSHYGFLGVLIAGATILSAKVSYNLSNRFSLEFLILCGTVCTLAGGFIFTLIVLLGIFELHLNGISIVLTLFLIFFGIGLIIPNSLSQALKSYQNVAGTAGSLFGGSYYFIIAGCTWLMSMLHNDTALPLPFYMTMLGVILAIGNIMIRQSQINTQFIEVIPKL